MLQVQTSLRGHQQKRLRKAWLCFNSTQTGHLHRKDLGAAFPDPGRSQPQPAGTFPVGALAMSPKSWSWGGDSKDMGTVAQTHPCSTGAARGTGAASPVCSGQHFLGYLQFLLPGQGLGALGLPLPALVKQCHRVENTLLSSRSMDGPQSPYPGPVHGPDTASPPPLSAATGALPSSHCLPKYLQGCSHPVPPPSSPVPRGCALARCINCPDRIIIGFIIK